MPDAALSNVKVLDLTHHIAGPYCTRLLAGYGAEVIKVEKPGCGDAARNAGPFPGNEPHPEKSGLFLYLNARKKGITLDLETETGKNILKDLAKDADILIENFAPGTMSRLGLDFETLEKINPRLVMVSISNFGQTGPYRDYKATDMIEYALGGLQYLTGDPTREPLRNGGSLAQYHGGMNAFVAALTALYARDEYGISQQVDVSIQESVASVLEQLDMNWVYKKISYARQGNGATPAWGVYPCKDGYVGVVSGLGYSFRRFKDLMEMPILGDPKFDSGFLRLQNKEELNGLITPWLMARTKEEIYHSAQALRLPFGYVCTAEDLLKSEQLKVREFFVDVDHPVAGKLTYPGAPIKMMGTPWQVGRAPLLGEHNEEIYCGKLGLEKEDLIRLTERGVI